jgi:TPR repeat protein
LNKDLKTAHAWHEKAATQGEVNAQFSIGWNYANGQGVEKNFNKAFEWYEKAALQGHPNAQNNMDIGAD